MFSIDTSKIVVVKFEANWCEPCRAMKPIFERISQKYRNKAHFLKIDVEEEPEFTASARIRSLPSFAVFKGGQVMNVLVGAVNESSLEEFIRNNL